MVYENSQCVATETLTQQFILYPQPEATFRTMRAYHFIKYNASTSLDNLIAQTHSNTTLCFDFEDSIQDCVNPENTPALKAVYRDYFKKIINNSRLHNGKIKVGIRINATDSPEHQPDLLVLAKVKHVTTVFIPKVSEANQILKLRHDLNELGVSYDEITPVIESKKGFNNIEEILRVNSGRIGGVAFGHCDYNYDNHIYPFFHQDSKEYWTWIKRIYECTKPYHLHLINSPFLQLDNDKVFKDVLNLLFAIGGSNVGQVTLSQKQTNICNAFSEHKTTNLPKLINRFDLRVPANYAENLIESYENNCNNKGFVINSERTILSPQEYLSSLNFLRKSAWPEINFTFVGGCFPVQGNMPFEDLFHQVLKRKVENTREIKLNVNIIQYERFRNCINKMASYKESQPIDILAFSIRPEPFLRLVKLFYRFKEKPGGKHKWSLNLPALNKINPEKYDLLSVYTRFNPSQEVDKSLMRKALLNLNYFLGSLFGNHKYALRKYSELVNEVIAFSKRNNIKLFIIGPPIRANTKAERLLSKRLDKFMRKPLAISPESFLSCSDPIYNGEGLFKMNGIFATEKYHELFADRMLEKLLPVIDKISGLRTDAIKTQSPHPHISPASHIPSG